MPAGPEKRPAGPKKRPAGPKKRPAPPFLEGSRPPDCLGRELPHPRPAGPGLKKRQAVPFFTPDSLRRRAVSTSRRLAAPLRCKARLRQLSAWLGCTKQPWNVKVEARPSTTIKPVSCAGELQHGSVADLPQLQQSANGGAVDVGVSCDVQKLNDNGHQQRPRGGTGATPKTCWQLDPRRLR